MRAEAAKRAKKKDADSDIPIYLVFIALRVPGR